MSRTAKIVAALLTVLPWLSVAPARAGGSLGLDEVMAAVASRPALAGEITDALAAAKLNAADVACVAARHDFRWENIDRSRAAPYACEIGARTVTITADRIYFDAKRRRLGTYQTADKTKARSFVESNFRWTWTATGATPTR